MSFWLSGIDEAGYGPTLGPLVVGMATLHGTEPFAPALPWRLLAPTVVKSSGKRGIAVADSKRLHRPQTGDLAPLELGVLSFVAAERGGEPPRSFRALVDHLTARRSGYLDDYPWYQGADLELPLSVPPLELVGATRRLERALARAGLTVAEVRALPLEVREFNTNLERRATKGDVNAWAIGRFLRWLWRQRTRTLAEARVDRLGGRQHYGSFLTPLVAGAELRVLAEGDEEQIYEARAGTRALTVYFSTEGEARSFPTALASMTAKYLRELHMVLLNRWWQQHDGALRATAGYPQDARRFLTDIQPMRHRLGVADEVLIRRR